MLGGDNYVKPRNSRQLFNVSNSWRVGLSRCSDALWRSDTRGAASYEAGRPVGAGEMKHFIRNFIQK